ncbi:MAG: DUF5916 domain-containing protein [Gemmatimonadota bacterium]
MRAISSGLFSDAYDPTLTALRGYAAYVRFGKQTGNWLWEAATNIRSPGFENNDIGFLTRAGYVYMNANVLRQYTEPGSFYRSLSFIAGGQQQFNYDGDRTDRQVQLYGSAEARNYWRSSSFWFHRWTNLDDTRLRGGPVVKQQGVDYVQSSLSTDSRKSVVGEMQGSYGVGREGTHSWSMSTTLQWRPLSNLSLSIGPSYNHDDTPAQYVRAFDDATATTFFGKRYLFATVQQRTLAMDTRLNVTFTPNLTLELFAQPFISSGAYRDYKEFAAPRELAKLVYGRDVGAISSVAGTGSSATQFTVDPDAGGPAASFSFADPSFTVRSLRGNAVLRWEYRPGSTLFLVWTQSRNDALTAGDINVGRDAGAVFSGPAENIFLVKVNYWLGL